MHCDQINEWMSEHLDGQLDPEREKLLAEHLESCATCRQSLEELQQTVSLLQGLEPVEPPAQLVNRVHAKLDQKESRTIWAIFSLPQTRVAIAAGFLIIVSLYGLREMERSRPSQVMSDAAPVSRAKLDKPLPQPEAPVPSVRMEDKAEASRFQNKLEMAKESGPSINEKMAEEVMDLPADVSAPAASGQIPADRRRVDSPVVADHKAKTVAPAPPAEPVLMGLTVGQADREEAQTESVPAQPQDRRVAGGKGLETRRSLAASDELKEQEEALPRKLQSIKADDHEKKTAYRQGEGDRVGKDADRATFALTIVSAHPDSVLPALEQAGWGEKAEQGAGKERGSARESEMSADHSSERQVVNIRIPASRYAQFVAQLQTLGEISSAEPLPVAKASPPGALSKSARRAVEGKGLREDRYLGYEAAASGPVTNGQEMMEVILTILPSPTGPGGKSD